MSRWDVFRDQEGKPVTITEEQGRAIWHAIHVVEQVRKAEGEPSLWAHQSPEIEIAKSRLLGRMLYQGRPPLDEKPPTYFGAAGYHLTDPDLCPKCGAPRSERGGELARSIDPNDDISKGFHSLKRPEEVPEKVITISYCNEEWHRDKKSIWKS